MKAWIQRGAFGAALMMTLAACASGGDPVSSPAAGPTSTVTTADDSPSSSIADATGPTAGGPGTIAKPDGVPAPDFTFDLGDGSTFSLGAETKPVYLVFWAEW